MRAKGHKELVDRWKDVPNLIKELTSRRGEPGCLADSRGIPIGDERNSKLLNNLEVSWADLSRATFQECRFEKTTFIGCRFERTNFAGVGGWDSKFIDCEFENADFRNASMGVRSLFERCLFRNTKLKGKYFNFGDQSKFRDSSFRDCEIQSAWIMSAEFETCVFTSSFKNLRFSGSLEASIRGNGAFPATFIDCDLSGSSFTNVEIMDGAVFRNTKLPDQTSERIFERTYFEGS